MSKYLDDSGLGHLWSILKGKIETKQDALLPDATLEVNGAHIGVSVPTEGMTQAEYDALPAAEKARGLKIITDSTPLPANYVEDYTTEDGWHVRKYSDGYVEMTARITGNTGIMNQWGTSGWYVTSEPSPAANYPIPLIALYACTATMDCSTVYAMTSSVAASSTTISRFQFFRVNADNNKSYVLNYHITGRWK